MCRLSELVFPVNKNLILPPLPSSYIKCTPIDSFEEFDEVSFIPSNLPFEHRPVIHLPVSSVKVLTQGEGVKTVIELTLSTKEQSFEYLPGDTIGILPQNPDDEVHYILERLHLSPGKQWLKIELKDDNSKKKNSLAHLPPEAPAKFLFKNCLDLRAVLKKSFLRSLIDYTSDDVEKRRLTELCCREGSGEYSALILSKKLCILDVLQTFPSCNPPLSLLLEHLPRLLPRPYSIASSSLGTHDSFRIVFNIVHDVNNRRGICSGWLTDITEPFHDITYGLKNLKLDLNSISVKIPVYLRKPTKFRIPTCPSVPLVMIGPGTGIAPFMGFLEHRKYQSPEQSVKNWLLFGCRYPKRDEIYKETLLKYEEEGLCHSLISYSRNKKILGENKYVQDSLKENQKDIIDQILSTGTCIFICGNNKMVKEILDTFVNCIQTVLGISEEEAKSRVSDLEKNDRIIKDLWF